MNWLIIASLAYFLIALQSILDKFLLSSRRVGHPATYAFYSGLLSLLAFFLFPFGFHAVNLSVAFWEFLAGAIFIYGILFLFFAIRDSEASQVIPVSGAITAVSTLLFSALILREKLSFVEVYGIIILIFGGLVISLDFSRAAFRKLFKGFEFSVLSGIFLGLAYVFFKKFYLSGSFVNVYIWTRFGLLLGAGSLLLYSGWRKIIFNSLARFKKPKNDEKNSGIIFVFNKALGGIGSFLLNYSISLGSVAIVNALVSLEYVFIFALAGFFSMWVEKIFDEKRDAITLIQKFVAIIIIAIGMVIVSR